MVDPGMASVHGNTNLVMRKIHFYHISRNEDNLVPSIPRLRENTKTSAPSLIVLVLKPFPSAKKQSKQTESVLCCGQKLTNRIQNNQLTLSNGILDFALRRITQGHTMTHLIWVHPPAIVYQQFKMKLNEVGDRQ